MTVRPCSRCGSRTAQPGCPRCAERELATQGTEADRLRFEQDEVQRLSRLEGPPWDDLPAAPLPIEVALVGSGIPRTIALVSCGKAKLATKEKVPARDLYVGQPFRMAFRHGLATADDVLILSALHGLVQPFELLAPYDFTMIRMRTAERKQWGQSVVNALRSAYPLRHLRIIFYAGRDYVDPILEALSIDDRNYWSIEDPLRGLGLFKRISWFKTREPIVIAHEE